MSKIEVKGLVSKKYKMIAEMVAVQSIKLLGQPDNLEVAINFVSEKEIKRLNRENRNIDRVTDVLSFPSTNTKAGDIVDLSSEDMIFLMIDGNLFHLGDMAICMKQLKRQAKEYAVTPLAELKKLVIHSMLHLFGYDHIKDEDYDIMSKQENILDIKINF